MSFIERFFPIVFFIRSVLYQNFYCTKMYFLQYFMHLAADMLDVARCNCTSHLWLTNSCLWLVLCPELAINYVFLTKVNLYVQLSMSGSVAGR